jgi:hypothetical protein
MSKQTQSWAAIAFIVGLSLPAAARAQTAPAAGPQVQVSGGVAPQTREDEIDDLRRYTSETTTTTTLADGRVHERYNRQQFDLETMAVTANGLLIRFTLRQAEARDAEQPFLGALLEGWVGVPVEVETTLAGGPRRIVNWVKARDAYAAALARLAPDNAEVTTNIVNALNAMEEGPRAAVVVADLALLASSQPRGPVREGRVDVPPETVAVSPERTVTVTRFADFGSVEPATCTARFQAGTTMAATAADIANSETMNAKLSTWDGWVIDLEQRTESRAPAGRAEKVVTIRRAAPGCG